MRIIFCLLTFTVALSCCCTPTFSAEKAAAIDLLTPSPTADGSAWKHFSEDPDTKFGDVWQVKDGVLICKGMPKGYIYTTRDYTNFVLRLEWRWPPEGKPGKGGVLLRTTGEHKIWPKCLEAQINVGDAGDFWGLGGYKLTGPDDRSKSLENPRLGRFTNVKKTENVEKPAGQWNRYEIVAKGDTVVLSINGREVNRATGCETAPGKILLTSEGNEIHFRNIRLIPMD